MKTFFKSNLGKLALLAIAVALYLLVPAVKFNVDQAISVLQNMDVDLARDYILGFGIWAPAISFLLMMLQSLIAPLPAFILTFANAALFGWVWGAVLSWSSAMAGAVLCFYLAKFLGRSFVEKLSSRAAVQKIDVFFQDYGKYAILIARLLPFISFDIVSYAAGLTSMRFWPFFIATGLGQLPATIIYSYIGSMLTGTVRTFVMGLLILFALSTLGFLLKKVWKDRSQDTAQTNSAK